MLINTRREIESSRTPSGNVLTNQVQSVRVFFSPKDTANKERIKRGREILNQHEKQDKHASELEHQIVNSDQSTVVCAESSELSVSAEISEPSICQSLLCDTTQTCVLQQGVNIVQVTDQTTSIGGQKRKERSESSEGENESDQQRQQTKTPRSAYPFEMQHQGELKSVNAPNEAIKPQQMDIDMMLKKIEREEAAGAIDVRTVVSMFKQLQTGINLQPESIKTIVNAEIAATMNDYETRIRSLESNLKASNRKTKMMEDILQFNAKVLDDVVKRLDSLELANARKAAILSGISFSNKKADRIKQIADFFYKEMEVYTRIEDAYTLGTAEKSPIVIIFQTMDDKNSIFEKKSCLKEISKQMNLSIYLNHYLPSKENEKKKRERKIISDLKNSSEEKKPEYSYGKNGFAIGNEKYIKKVSAPNPTDLLKYSVDELDEILQCKTAKGVQIREKDSIFIPYTLDAKDYQSIRDAYMKLRLLHPTANHIVCAYHLPSPDATKHINSDSCDDQEYGAGAQILNEMQKSDVFNKAIFVVRYSGKEKLMEKRQELYVKAAKKVLQEKPYNTVLGKKQAFSETQQEKVKAVGYRYRQEEDKRGPNSEKNRKQNPRTHISPTSAKN